MEIEKYYNKFSSLLTLEDKEGAFHYAHELLSTGKMDVIQLYSEVLTPAINNTVCAVDDKRICIWQEHVRTAILRTIVESCFPYVLQEKTRRNVGRHGTAVVLCPPEEYHDLGARMTADYMTICGYNTVFVGSNTPYTDFLNGVEILHPNLVAISVSNYFHVVITKKIVGDLRQLVDSSVKIVVGGYAFDSNPDHVKAVGADFYLRDFDDIEALVQKEKTVERK